MEFIIFLSVVGGIGFSAAIWGAIQLHKESKAAHK